MHRYNNRQRAFTAEPVDLCQSVATHCHHGSLRNELDIFQLSLFLYNFKDFEDQQLDSESFDYFKSANNRLTESVCRIIEAPSILVRNCFLTCWKLIVSVRGKLSDFEHEQLALQSLDPSKSTSNRLKQTISYIIKSSSILFPRGEYNGGTAIIITKCGGSPFENASTDPSVNLITLSYDVSP